LSQKNRRRGESASALGGGSEPRYTAPSCRRVPAGAAMGWGARLG